MLSGLATSLGAGLRRAGQPSNRLILVRFCKYVVLIACVALTLRVVFDAYSFYVARRDIDAELRSKRNVSSLEYLGVLSQRKRALAITTLEGRCMERTQLTLFRIFDAEHDMINSAYNAMMSAKTEINKIVKASGPGLIDADKASHFITYQDFTLANLDDYLAPTNAEIASSDKYKAFRSEVDKLRKKYVDIAIAHAPLREKIETLIKGSKLDESKYWNMDAIKKVSERNVQVREELAEVKKQVGDIEEVMARYGVWTGALTGGAANNPVLDEIAYQIEKANADALKEQNCKGFKDYYKSINNRILELDPFAGQSWRSLTWGQKIESIPRLYRQSLLTYFNQPPAAQTLFVTMFLGALGALTLNVLRMSKVGYWSMHEDPLWGEIVVGPLLGALAAFGIFLIGSSGLLLTSDSSGSQPLSAYFIGLLGFLSGLLYDEAFGRVRRVGTQMFSAKTSEDPLNVRAEDLSLAKALRGNSASLAADLFVKYGIGTRIGLESEFTLLVPSDEAMGRLPLVTWNGLNDRDHDLFEKWYHRHHAGKRLGKGDVAGSEATPAAAEIRADDGTSYALKVDGGEFKIADVRVLVADIKWDKGVIHILSGELPE